MGLGNVLDARVGSLNKTRGRRKALPFDYTFAERLRRERKMRIKKILRRCAAVTVTSAVWALGIGTTRLGAQSKTKTAPACCGAKKRSAASKKATAKFSSRAEALLEISPANKGEWGLLIVDAESGETLYEQSADKYFVPASNMKLFTTALALAKLVPEYHFHTTLDTHAAISSEGVLSADVVLVGRGDPNLSNRKFPYELKEEFDGPQEKALADLAEAVAAKGVKEISGDVVGDNSVALTLTPGEQPGNAVQAAVTPATPDFLVENNVTTSAADVKPDLTLTREPGSNLVVVKGSLPAKSAPRKLVLASEEPAQHAAALLKRLLEERGIKVAGVAKARHDHADPAGDPVVLAEHVSVPLGDAVKLINKISQNLHTEMLLRTVARQSGLWATPDELMKVPADFYTTAGIAPGDVIQADASGLSRHDLVTPRAIVTMLSFAQKQSWFATYYASLPVAGVDGTLEDRMKNTPAAGRIHAKTGSVEHVRTLSGFAETASGRRVIFSFLSNNQGGKSHEAADALTGLCVAMLEEFNVTPPKRALEHKRPL